MDKRRTLVTGGTGFIGQNLIRALVARGDEVLSTSRSDHADAQLKSISAIPLRCDFSSFNEDLFCEQLVDIDCVFHLAGRVAGTLPQLMDVNEAGTAKLTKALSRLAKRPRLILVSSVAAAGPSKPTEPRTESITPSPISNYGKSKLAGERAAIRHCRELELSIVRPGIVFGAGDKEFNLILRAMNRTSLNPLIGFGRQPLSFIEVNDLVRLLLAVVEKGERVERATAEGDSESGRGIYYGCANEPLSLRSLGHIFSNTLRRPIVPVFIAPPVAAILGYASELMCTLTGKSSTLNRDKILEGKAPSWFCSPQKAIDQLGWQPRLSLDETMAGWIRTAKHQGLM